MDNNNKPVLLFVDDSKVMRLAADKMLGREFRVEVAENGVEAWEMICHNPAISVNHFFVPRPLAKRLGLGEGG